MEKTIKDPMVAPDSYDELFRQYQPYVRSWLVKLGIWASDADDTASEVLLRFMERDMLAKFDPTLVFEYKGEKRPARFQSFLNAFVKRYAMGYRDTQMRKAKRGDISLDLDIFRSESSDGGTIQELLAAPRHTDQYDREEIEFLEQLSHLDLEARVSRQLPVTLRQVLETVYAADRQAEAYERLQTRFGISSTTAGSWLKKLRIALTPQL